MHDYYGHLYAGSEYIEMRIVYDTTNQHTLLIDETTQGISNPSMYVQSESSSSVEIFTDYEE